MSTTFVSLQSDCQQLELILKKAGKVRNFTATVIEKKDEAAIVVEFGLTEEATPWEFMHMKEFAESNGYMFEEEQDTKDGRTIYFYIISIYDLPF